jgi:hypothetical protein
MELIGAVGPGILPSSAARCGRLDRSEGQHEDWTR